MKKYIIMALSVAAACAAQAQEKNYAMIAGYKYSTMQAHWGEVPEYVKFSAGLVQTKIVDEAGQKVQGWGQTYSLNAGTFFTDESVSGAGFAFDKRPGLTSFDFTYRNCILPVKCESEFFGFMGAGITVLNTQDSTGQKFRPGPVVWFNAASDWVAFEGRAAYAGQLDYMAGVHIRFGWWTMLDLQVRNGVGSVGGSVAFRNARASVAYGLGSQGRQTKSFTLNFAF